MLSFVLAFTGPAFSQDEAPFDNSSLREDGHIIAFVGRKIFVRKDDSFPPKRDENSDEIIIHLDSRYQVRYEIIDLIAGKYQGRIIDFHAYDHYGIPRFSRVENALIFIHDGPDNRVHSNIISMKLTEPQMEIGRHVEMLMFNMTPKRSRIENR